jgi:bile acid-coenzyme A ligase
MMNPPTSAAPTLVAPITSTTISFVARLRSLAAQSPDRTAVTCGPDSVSRAELEAWTNRLARVLAGMAVGVGDMVTIAVPNSVEWVAVAIAAWKVGAIPQPVSSRLPWRELAAMVSLANPKVIVGSDDASLGV